jgi:hypothetical protein
LPEWITVGQRVGYLSSSGRVCEGFIESVSLENREVKFVFAEDERVWKRIQFSTIVSKVNPLRRLAVKSDRSNSMTEMLNAAQQMDIDKSIMLTRILGDNATHAVGRKDGGSDAGNSNSAAPEPGSAPGSACSRSRSRSPRPKVVESDQQNPNPLLPAWVVVGKRARYLSKSSGTYKEVDIESISESEVKVVFIDDRACWKGIPFSMLNSRRNPLRPLEADLQQSAEAVVDLGSDASADGSMSSGVAEVSPKKQIPKLPAWITVGQRCGYVSKSSGKLCAVEVDSISMDRKEVKIVFADNREVWKGLPFSLILSPETPLRKM